MSVEELSENSVAPVWPTLPQPQKRALILPRRATRGVHDSSLPARRFSIDRFTRIRVTDGGFTPRRLSPSEKGTSDFRAVDYTEPPRKRQTCVDPRRSSPTPGLSVFTGRATFSA